MTGCSGHPPMRPTNYADIPETMSIIDCVARHIERQFGTVSER